ncbi:MAG: CDGSH iron-sulfur domain-containing protein [Actinomycetota bacterium]
MEVGEQRIRIKEHGPYEVSGGPPLGRTAQIETEFGEPVDWAPMSSIDAPTPTFALCRCGLSSRKPFCDEVCSTAGFDGTEVADRAPRSTRAETYIGDEVVMTDDHTFCEHAGYCGDRFTNVWRMIRQTSDPEIRERLQRMVSLCPSGALDHAPSEGADPVELAFEPSIGVVRDGPLWVRGGIPIESSDGTTYEVRNRVTLCRCGHSGNKPFCDGTHKEVEFRDG